MHEAYETFLLEFGGEEACYEYFYHCRWPSGYRCPSCGHANCYTISSRRMPLYECAHCRFQTSVTSGTALEGTRTLLSKWLFAMKLLSHPASGINAVLLSKMLKVTYKTAYAMLDKIRHCLSLVPPEKLAGEIQAGISIMGWAKDSSYDLTEKQHPIAVGISLDENGEPDRLAMMVVPRTHMLNNSLNPSGRDLFREIHFSDDAASLSCAVYHSQLLTIKRCRHLVPVYKASFKQINGTYRGVHPRSLPKYLAEVTFRWNAARSNKAGITHQMARTCMAYSLPGQAA